MQRFPTRSPALAAVRALASAIAGDAISDAGDAADLFGVEVDQLAELLALVRMIGTTGSSALSRPAPTAPYPPSKLTTGRRAITGPNRRLRRRMSISASSAASPNRGGYECGRNVRSARPDTSSRFGNDRGICVRSCHRRHVRATATTVQPSSRGSTISVRLRVV